MMMTNIIESAAGYSLDSSWSEFIAVVRSTQYAVYAWPYVTHAFRQSADSSGLCPIQLAWSIGIGSWCCVVLEPNTMLTELVKTTTNTW